MFWTYVGWAGFALFGLWMMYLLIQGTFFTVKEANAAVVERFGAFTRVAGPGLRMKIPLIDRVAALKTLQVQTLQVDIETKTQDQAFLRVPVSVQFAIDPMQVNLAHYKLERPATVIADRISDVLRGKVPTMAMEAVFVGKFGLADEIFEELKQEMSGYGYEIRAVLITDLILDDQTRKAMQLRFSAQRQKEAAVDLAEAEKTRLKGAAEAEAEARVIEGRGIADQREVIVERLRKILGETGKVDPELVTKLMVMSEYFDSLQKIGGQGKVIFLPHGPASVKDLEAQLRGGLMANELGPPSR